VKTSHCLIVALVLLTAIPDFLQSQENDAATTQTDTTGRTPDPQKALLLGLIPGGGQLYNGKWFKALLVVAAEGYLAYNFIRNRDFYNNYDEYDPPLPKNKNAYMQERNKYAWQVLFVYIFGLIDGYVDAHLSSFPDDASFASQPELSISQTAEDNL